MLDFFRTGEPIRDRPDRYRMAIERLTAQDIAVFFQEALAALPAARRRPVPRRPGGRRPLRRRTLADRHGPPLPGARAGRRGVRGRFGGPRAGRTSRRPGWPTGSRSATPASPSRARPASTTWPTSSTRSTSCPTRRRSCERPGRPSTRAADCIVLDWPLPSERDEFRTRHGELIVGVQLDELYQGTALATRDQFLAWFAAADLPPPTLIDLPSGASLFVAERA